MSDLVDPMTVIAIAGVILLIVFTGYLIIYNVFQISVAGDIRFYGLLKTSAPRRANCGASSGCKPWPSLPLASLSGLSLAGSSAGS